MHDLSSTVRQEPSSATCDMRHATCGMQRAACNMRHATCGMQNCNMHRATCGMQNCNMQPVIPGLHRLICGCVAVAMVAAAGDAHEGQARLLSGHTPCPIGVLRRRAPSAGSVGGLRRRAPSACSVCVSARRAPFGVACVAWCCRMLSVLLHRSIVSVLAVRPKPSISPVAIIVPSSLPEWCALSSTSP